MSEKEKLLKTIRYFIVVLGLLGLVMFVLTHLGILS